MDRPVDAVFHSRSNLQFEVSYILFLQCFIYLIPHKHLLHLVLI